MNNWELEHHLMNKESKVDYFDEPRVTFLYDKEKKLFYSDKWENSSYVHFCPISRKLNREIEIFYKRIALFHFISKTEMSTKKKAIEYLKKYKDKNIFTDKEFSVLVDCYIYLKIDLVKNLLEGVSSDYEKIEELKGISNSFLFGYMLQMQKDTIEHYMEGFLGYELKERHY